MPVKICSNPDSCGGDVQAFRARFQNDEVSENGLTGFVWTEDRLEKNVGVKNIRICVDLRGLSYDYKRVGF